MAEPGVAPEVRELLRRCIDTYEKLSVVLWLRQRTDAVELADVANAVDLDLRTVRELLAQLKIADLIVEEKPGCFCYRPRLTEQRATVDALADLFESEPVRVVQLMSRNAFERLRSTAAAAFAEAVLNRKTDRK
jgi:hypothetical protein